MDNNAKKFQNEYAMYVAVSELFHIVRNRSMKIKSLMIYFKELPHRKEKDSEETSSTRRITQEELLEKFKAFVKRDLLEYVDFPMMESCAVEVFVYHEKDGSHTFAFTDGIYGFMVHLEFGKGRKGNRYVKGIRVTDLGGNLLNDGSGNCGRKAAA